MIPSPSRSQDPAMQTLDDMSASPFVPAILHQDAPPHFMLPKFHMYDGLEDPFDRLMHFHQVMTLQRGNDALVCMVFPSLVSLGWHCLSSIASPLNTGTFFHALFEKFITQYMCSIRRKQSMTSLFHERMGRSELIRDFMKCFKL